MAAIQTRERSGSTRKPFGWIQRLYKKSSQADVEQRAAIDLDGPSKNGNMESAFYQLGSASAVGSFAANDMSSLRPTISTRAPSIAQSMVSNAAIRNVDAISSDVHSRDQELTPTMVDNGRFGFSHSPINDDETLVDDGHVSHLRPQDSSSNEKESDTPETSAEDTHEVTRKDRHDSQYTTSSYSSKESPMPSLFSTRTTETAPTISLFTHPASVISARTTGAGHGAQDNASMLTLASSSKGPHRRRTSTDTNCSVRALAPASARASFESSRTGLTDPRRMTNPSSHPIFLDDSNMGQSIASGRSRQPNNESMSTRRSVSGLSAVTVQSAIDDED